MPLLFNEHSSRDADCKENRPSCAWGFETRESSQLTCSHSPSMNEEINQNFEVRLKHFWDTENNPYNPNLLLKSHSYPGHKWLWRDMKWIQLWKGFRDLRNQSCWILCHAAKLSWLHNLRIQTTAIKHLIALHLKPRDTAPPTVLGSCLCYHGGSSSPCTCMLEKIQLNNPWCSLDTFSLMLLPRQINI